MSSNGGDIDKIVLVGGPSLTPIVQEFIRDEFDIEIESTLNPLTVCLIDDMFYLKNCVISKVN